MSGPAPGGLSWSVVPLNAELHVEAHPLGGVQAMLYVWDAGHVHAKLTVPISIDERHLAGLVTALKFYGRLP